MIAREMPNRTQAFKIAPAGSKILRASHRTAQDIPPYGGYLQSEIRALGGEKHLSAHFRIVECGLIGVSYHCVVARLTGSMRWTLGPSCPVFPVRPETPRGFRDRGTRYETESNMIKSKPDIFASAYAAKTAHPRRRVTLYSVANAASTASPMNNAHNLLDGPYRAPGSRCVLELFNDKKNANRRRTRGRDSCCGHGWKPRRRLRCGNRK